MGNIRMLMFLWLVLCGPIARGQAADREWVIGMESLHRLDVLPRLKSSVRVASVSSYDRSGGNDDGFSGKYSFVRKEPGGLVIADLKGPGVITRIWTPTPSDAPVEFFFDGEAEPRIRVKFREMFLGKERPFLAPLCGYGAGGFFSYVPIPFAKSCKIRVCAERVQFYQVNYAVYPEDAPVTSFRPKPTSSWIGHREKVAELFAAAGSDITASTAPRGARVHLAKSAPVLRAGQSVSVFETDAPGRIVGIRLAPASAFEGKDRGLLLKISFDGDNAPAVICPVGDFFGYAWGQPAMRSLLVGTSEEGNYCYFPMPFDRSAKLEIVSERTSGPPVQLRAEVAWAAVPRSPDEGRFYALWRRENPTRIGTPFTFLETQGNGHLVGCVLQCQGRESGKTLYFEGDDQTTIDGELVIHGTGSEDFFNGGWYDVPDRWMKRLSFPLSGCLGYQKHLGRTGAYRFFLADAYPFRERILQTIEHGGTGNSIPTDYSAVTYFYAKDKPSVPMVVATADQRRVVDFTRVVFPAWWQIPITSFCFNAATLGRKSARIADEDVRFLSLAASGQDMFGPPFVTLVCDIPVAGKYAISLEVVKGPAQGCVQLFRDEVPVGEPSDLYAERRAKTTVRLGELTFSEGPNNVMLKIVAKNEKSTALGLDLVHVICEASNPR